MAVSAFKSSSRRGILTSSSTTSASPSAKERKSGDRDDFPKKATIQRSRSVSAFSRTSVSDTSCEFSNSRDNPLFWTSGSPPPDEVHSKLDGNSSKFGAGNSKSTGSVENTRGRSVSRNADVGSKVSGGRKTIGRSLSRVDIGRRDRSVSRPPVSTRLCVNSESEVEQKIGLTANTRNRSKPSSVASNSKETLIRSNPDKLDPLQGLRTWSSQHSPYDASDNFSTTLTRPRQFSPPTLNFENGASTSSNLSGDEEKTIKAVCEQMKSEQGDCLQGDTAPCGIYETIQSEIRRAIVDIQNDLATAMRRSNGTDFATTDLADVPLDLVNPGAVQLVTDMRTEYAKKLEHSRERARRLRADLAVEEHRGQELSRILREILPDHSTSAVQKSRSGRKGSIERRKMSKRLTEEAMTYFDECVSLSTFDSSDFSSQEDPPFNPGVTTPVRNSASRLQEADILRASTSCNDITANSSNKVSSGDQEGASGDRKFQFSFTSKPTKTVGTQLDIEKYIRNIDQGGSPESQMVSSNHFDMEEYKFLESSESLLFDQYSFRNRIESGSLHLCCVSSGMPLPPFTFII